MLFSKLFQSSVRYVAQYAHVAHKQRPKGTVHAATVPEATRGIYASLNGYDLAFFEGILGSANVLTDAHDLEGYNTDWTHAYKGHSNCVLKPSSTEQISAVLAHCVSRNLAVVPQSGNTGLVGGSVPVFDEVILSTKRLNKVHEFDETSGILTADAGCILENLENEVNKHGYIMPLDLASKGSCCIGGNVSTAAGGIRLIRYGSLHAHVLGIEAVLPDSRGTVLDFTRGLRKDNTGLHLPHLFIGSEGQLGVITKVVMTCVAKPQHAQVALLGCDTFQQCCAILKLAKRQLSQILSSFEFMDCATIKCVEDNLRIQHPLQTSPNFFVLIEITGNDQEQDLSTLERFLETCYNDDLVGDCVLASGEEQRRKIWHLRERGTEAFRRDGYTYKQDLSLPLQHFYDVVEATRERLGDLPMRVMGQGHIGDGNIHLNITSEAFSQELYDRLYPWLFDWVSKHNGSISAEHGLGQLKRKYAHYSQSATTLAQMRRVKQMFDEKRILNPYKTLDSFT